MFLCEILANMTQVSDVAPWPLVPTFVDGNTKQEKTSSLHLYKSVLYIVLLTFKGECQC
jgi:hypothetical protein